MEQILGLPELDKNIQALIREIDSDEFVTGMLQVGAVLRDELKNASPIGPVSNSKKQVKLNGISVGTELTNTQGNLKKSWREKKFKSKRIGNPAVWVANDRKTAPHAHLVEYGHGGIHPAPAHPFVRPTIDRFKGKYAGLVATMLRERFNRTI
jgi:HK97 gp10 family phage protein